MALFNYATKEITLKIVYYGPGLSGKTTNLQHLHSILNPETRGRLLSLSTETDRTLFFDFLPVELGKIRDFSIRFQLYTVPGQVRYNATRKIVLKGADAVIFVADSQRDMKEQNIESFENMRENLFSNNINPDEIPIILQYNKRDLVNIASLEELDADLNHNESPVIEACAIKGLGVEESFKLVTKLLLRNIAKKHQIEIKPAKEEEMEAEGPVTLSQGAHFPPPAPAAVEMQTVVSSDKDITAGDAKLSTVVEVPPTEKMQAEAYESSWETKKNPITELREVPVIFLEKIEQVAKEISEIHKILADSRDSIKMLGKEMENLKELRKEQEKIGSLLKDLSVQYKGLKRKRSWFRF